MVSVAVSSMDDLSLFPLSPPVPFVPLPLLPLYPSPVPPYLPSPSSSPLFCLSLFSPSLLIFLLLLLLSSSRPLSPMCTQQVAPSLW